MTPTEFKAWLRGYLEAIEGAPSEQQKERILKALDEVKEQAPAIDWPMPDHLGMPPHRYVEELPNPQMPWVTTCGERLTTTGVRS